MLRSVLATTLVFLSTVAASASPPPRVTYFGESLLSRCDLVVVGVVAGRTVLPNGVAVTSLRVGETLLGEAPGERLLLSSPDPNYFGRVDRRLVVFLARGKSGRGYATIERFDVEDEIGRSRLRIARAYIECEAITGIHARVKSARGLHMSNLTGKDGWARDNAIRELDWFTRHWARTFTRAERDRIDAVRTSLAASPLRDMLTASLRRIDAVLPRSPAEPTPEAAPDREGLYRRSLAAVSRAVSATERAGRLAALVRARPARARRDLPGFLNDGAAEVRRVAAFQIGETECAPAADALVEVLKRPREDAEVKRNAARALGILRHVPAVPLLVTMLRSDDGRHAETAVLALARIAPRSPDAAAALGGFEPTVKGDDARAKALRKRLAFVASPDFAKQEAVLAKLRKSRLAADR
jgi:hypothetical protein